VKEKEEEKEEKGDIEAVVGYTISKFTN